jgi:hypothetical protein
MANRSVDKEANDMAMKGIKDPVVAKLAAELAQIARKWHCNMEDSAKAIAMVTHIQERLRSAHPPSADAWKGQMGCLSSDVPGDQEFNTMAETAQQLYEQYAQYLFC